jgi:DNA-binding NtrC family response regulator
MMGLAVDSLRSAYDWLRGDEGYNVQIANDGRQAIEMLRPGIDLVIADLVMPNVDGRELLRWVTQNHPGTSVILMTGFGTIPQAVDAIKAGATAYLTKPLNPSELLVQVRKALEDRRLRQELSRLRGQLREGWHYRNIVGQSSAMQPIFAMIDRAAPVKATVLLIGESGTGKEMVARALHEGGPRKSAAFLAINCGAIPENLIESTLFGHERGAFTGADQKSRGYFQAASGGTLLLDEIGELPLGLQSKLLRVLEDGAVTPVGQTTPQKVDVRIVAATNRDMEAQVKAGTFREDLYYRLNVVKIALPSLRQRREDIPILTRHFLDEICKTNGFESREIDPSLLDAFAKYDWPGNVRELKNTLESLVVLSGKRILAADDLPDKFFKSDPPSALPAGNVAAPASPAAATVPPDDNSSELNLSRLSRQTILKALDACHGNRTEAARQLGISRRTLHRRLNEFGLRE